MSEPPGESRSTIQKRDAAGAVRHGGEWLVIWSDPDSIKTASERAAEASAHTTRGGHQRRIAAALRSVARQPKLKVSFGFGVPALDVGLPEIPLEPTSEDLDVARGAADRTGLRLRHHDAQKHATLAPAEARRRMVFDCLEWARCEALGVSEMPGIALNLAAALARRLLDLGLSRAHIAAQIPLDEALPMLALDALLGRDQPMLATGALEMWHRFARANFGPALVELQPLIGDQAAFGAAAHTAVSAIFAAMEWDTSPFGTMTRGPERAAFDDAPGLENGRTRLGAAMAQVEIDDPDTGEPDTALEQPLRPEPPPREDSSIAEPFPTPYRVFTEEFDRVFLAEDLASPAELGRLRQQLDEQLGDMRAQLARVANRLQRQLLAQQNTSWDFDLDEGLLDSGRLDRVIVHPGAALSFKQERAARSMDTVVSILIDNSGSMRGRAIALAAMSADLAARALDRCGVRCEVLGFTTRSWKGGQSARKWSAAGRVSRPGRVNDLLHIVYKSASSSYRRAHNNLGLMLQDGVLKENVDGEALTWAVRRLRMRRESRKLLLVISDGAPADQATLSANQDPMYLDRHLRQVIADIENSGEVELSAIGINHDVRRYYAEAATIDSADVLGTALLSQLGRSLRPDKRGKARSA